MASIVVIWAAYKRWAITLLAIFALSFPMALYFYWTHSLYSAISYATLAVGLAGCLIGIGKGLLVG
jgi:hypothetical protein